MTKIRSLYHVALTTLGAFTIAATCAAEDKMPGYNHDIPKEIMTPDTVETRLGTLKFFDGLPDEDTVSKIYDNLDVLRGVETFLNGIPATSIEGLRRGHLEISGSTPPTRR